MRMLDLRGAESDKPEVKPHSLKSLFSVSP